MRRCRPPLCAHMQDRIRQSWRAGSCCLPRLLPKIRVQLTRCNKLKTRWHNQHKPPFSWLFRPNLLRMLTGFRHGVKPPMMVYSAGRWCRVWLRWWLSWGWLGVSWGEAFNSMQLARYWRKHLRQQARQRGHPVAEHSWLCRVALRQRSWCPLHRGRCCATPVWTRCCRPTGRLVAHPHCKCRPAFCAVPHLIQPSVEF